MKLKKEVLILVVIIAGLSLYLAMRSKDRTHFELPHISSVDQHRVDRLVFKKGR